MKILVCRFVKGATVALWFRCEKAPPSAKAVRYQFSLTASQPLSDKPFDGHANTDRSNHLDAVPRHDGIRRIERFVHHDDRQSSVADFDRRLRFACDFDRNERA